MIVDILVVRYFKFDKIKSGTFGSHKQVVSNI